MKYEQVVPDYIVMLESSITILALVGCGWLLFKLVSRISYNLLLFAFVFVILRLVSACIWFPQYMKNLEVEADKANKHVEDTLLPKKPIFDDEDNNESCNRIVEDEEKANSSQKHDETSIKERKKSKQKDGNSVTLTEKLSENPTDDDHKKEK